MREPSVYEIKNVQQHNHNAQLVFTLAPSVVDHLDADERPLVVVVVAAEQIAEIAAAVAKVIDKG